MREERRAKPRARYRWYLLWLLPLLLLLSLLAAWLMRAGLAQRLAINWFEQRGWDAELQLDSLDLQRGASFDLSLERPGAKLMAQGVRADWDWSQGRWRLAELEIENLRANWDQLEAPWEDLGLVDTEESGDLGKTKGRGERRGRRSEAEAEAARFGLAPSFEFRIENTDLSWAQGEQMSASWQGPLELYYGSVGSLHLVGQSASAKIALGKQLRMKGAPGAVDLSLDPVGQLKVVATEGQWRVELGQGRQMELSGLLRFARSRGGDMELLAELDQLQLEARDWPQAGGSAEVEMHWEEDQLRELLGSFELDRVDSELGVMAVRGSLGMVLDLAGVYGLSASLRSSWAESGERLLGFDFTGAGSRKEGELQLELRTGKEALSGEGGWGTQGWQMRLDGRVAPPLALLERFVGEHMEWDLFALGLDSAAEVRLADLELSGDFAGGFSASGPVRVRRLRLLKDGVDCGSVDAEAELSYQQGKGVLLQRAQINLPFAEARGTAQLAWRENRELTILGWGWEAELYQLSGLLPWARHLAMIEGAGQLQQGWFRVQRGESGQIEMAGKLSSGWVESYEPLRRADELSSGAISYRQKGSGEDRIRTLQVVDLRANTLRLKQLNLANLHASMVWDDDGLQLGQVTLKALGGGFWIEPATIPLPKGRWATTLHWKQVDLARVAGLIPGFDGRMRGRIDGWLPLAFVGFELLNEFEGGLNLSPGTEAWMSAQPTGLFSLSGNPRAEEAEGILESYQIQELEGVLLPHDDPTTLVSLHIRGMGLLVPGELNLNIPVTTDQPELFGSLWQWISNVGQMVVIDAG